MFDESPPFGVPIEDILPDPAGGLAQDWEDQFMGNFPLVDPW